MTYLSLPNTILASLDISRPISLGDIISYVPPCFNMPSYKEYKIKLEKL